MPAEYRTIHVERAARRALKDHFAAKTMAYRLWDEFGGEPESKTVRDMIATWVQRGDQAKAVMVRILGRHITGCILLAYHRKVFLKQYGEEYRRRVPLEKRMEKADPAIRELW